MYLTGLDFSNEAFDVNGFDACKFEAISTCPPGNYRGMMIHLMFKLSQCAQKHWLRQGGFSCLAKVIIKVKFRDTIEVTESNPVAA